MQKVLTGVAVFVTFLIAGCVQQEAPTPEQAWIEALEGRNLEQITELYGTNATLQYGDQFFSGKRQIVTFWTEQFSGPASITQLSEITYNYNNDRINVSANYSILNPRPAGVEIGTFAQSWYTDGVDWYIDEEVWTVIDVGVSGGGAGNPLGLPSGP
jgi:hypothetical protein